MTDIYSTRSCQAWCKFDDFHFDAANRDFGAGTLQFLGGGCLDAVSQIPAGSVKSFGDKYAYCLPTWIARDDYDFTEQELKARNELADRLISEILAEINLD